MSKLSSFNQNLVSFLFGGTARTGFKLRFSREDATVSGPVSASRLVLSLVGLARVATPALVLVTVGSWTLVMERAGGGVR